MVMRLFLLLLIPLVAMLPAACSQPEPTPDIEATVIARVQRTMEAQSEVTATPVPTQTSGTTAATLASMPLTVLPSITPNPTFTALPIITRASLPTATPTEIATILPTRTLTPIPTLAPTKTSTFTPTSTPVPTSTRTPRSTPVPTSTRPPTLTPTPTAAPIQECGDPTVSIVDTLGEAHIFDEFSGRATYERVFRGSYVGPAFTLTEETLIKEIGAFLINPSSDSSLDIRIVRSLNGKPDPSDIIHRTKSVSDDGQSGRYSYESVKLNLTLSEGEYFALFSDRSVNGGRLLTSTRESTYPYSTLYLSESWQLGKWNPDTGATSRSTGRIAARVLGRPSSSAVNPKSGFDPTSAQVPIWVFDVAISPSLGLLASAYSDGWARLWELRSGKKARFFDHDGQAVTTLAFSPDGDLLITGTSGGRLILWDPGFRNTRLFNLRAHRKPVTSVSFSHDGNKVASASENGWVRLWTVETTEELKRDRLREAQFEQAANIVTFSPNEDNLIVAMAVGNRVELWGFDTWEKFLVLEERSQVNSLSFHSDGAKLFVGLKDGTVSLWDLEDGDRLRSFQLETTVSDLAISPDGALLAVGSRDNAVHLWNIDRWSEICKIVGHKGDVTSVTFSPVDNRVLASGALDGTVRIWKIAPTLEPTTLSDLPPEIERIFATGLLAIPQTWLVDLDAGVVAAGVKAVDIWFEAVTETERYITPGTAPR